MNSAQMKDPRQNYLLQSEVNEINQKLVTVMEQLNRADMKTDEINERLSMKEQEISELKR
jgi:chromosome segregation ATPase